MNKPTKPKKSTNPSVSLAGLQSLADIPDLKFVTTGIKELDELVQFPCGRISEIYGLQGVGKTHLVSKSLAAMSNDSRVLYVDVENALNPQRLKDLGAKPENIVISDLYILEEVANFVIENLYKFDVIVIDSIAALVPKPEAEGQTGDQFVGLKAKLMHQWVRKVRADLDKSHCALVFVNQIRDSMNIYVPKYTPGGTAIPFAASLRIELKTTKADRKVGSDGSVEGHYVTAEITKSKFSAPHRKTRFYLEY